MYSVDHIHTVHNGIIGRRIEGGTVKEIWIIDRQNEYWDRRGQYMRKHSGQGNKNQKYRKLDHTPSESKVNLKVNQGPGRPRIKQTQRKKTPLPRQVSNFNRAKLMKAAAVLRKGEY